MPCLNGTVRPDGTELCVPCPSALEHAPYLGMTECECIPGYERDPSSLECTPIAGLDAPGWYTTLVSSSSELLFLLAAGAGVAAFVFAFVLLCLF